MTRRVAQVPHNQSFTQTGAYTNTLRPSLLEPRPPVMARAADGSVSVVKRRERMADVFASYRLSGEAWQ